MSEHDRQKMEATEAVARVECVRLASGRDPHQPMNPFVEREQRWIERFVKDEYWRLASLRDGRFAFTRASLTKWRG